MRIHHIPVGLELGNDARLLEAPGRQCNAFADRIDPDVLAGAHANGEPIRQVVAGTTGIRRFNMPDKPTIVFAHGLWADGSCYSKVIPLLLADGFQVISTQNHLNTVADDAAAVRTSFARASGPVVLVGHSYGGTVITAAGTDKRVAALIYICAFAPEDGDTTLVDQDKYPATPIFQHIEVVEGRIWLRPSGVPEFAGDLSEAEQQLVWATQMAPLADLFGQPVPGAAWKLKPTSYIVGSDDRTIQPELQRFLAKRMNAKVTEVASSHVPMLSQPRRVYEVIRDAAVNIQR
jgi:pimeloyl-ACP methyl ester carboxylesterase